jgi:surface antigen
MSEPATLPMAKKSTQSVLPKRPHAKIKMLHARMPAFFAALLLVTSSIFLSLPSSIAHADTLNYPWPTDTEAPCKFGTAGGADCHNTAEGMGWDKYNWGVYNSNNVFQPYRNGYQYRNCTDYTQWRITDLGGTVPAGLGNGGNWYNNSPTNKRSSTPQAGYAAVKPTSQSDAFGHVAVVESVNSNGTITISEYNGSGTGFGRVRIGTASSMGFTQFINFGATVPGSANNPVGLNQGVKLNDDSRNDFITARTVGGFTVAYGSPNGTLTEGPLSLTNWTVPSWAGAADTNGDGYSDILVAQPSGGFALALGHGNGSFTEGGVTLSGWGIGAWTGTGNFYGDSRGDLVVARSSGGFAVAYGTANGTLAEGPVSLTNWTVGSWAGTGDVNGDGYTDILVAQPGGGFAVALGHADGVFTEGGAMLSGWNTSGWGGTGNFSGDSRTDLVVTRSTGGFAVATGTPNGTLIEGPVSLTNWSISSWAGTGDFNGDGYTDILVAQPNGGFALALGHADGIFTEGGVTLSGWGTGNWASNGAFVGTKGYGYKKP